MFVCLSVCLSVCLCRVFLSRLRSDFDQTRTHVTCPGLVVSPRIGALRPLGAGWPKKTSIFRGLGAAVNHHSVAASLLVYIECNASVPVCFVTELPDQRPQVVVELANTVAYEGTVGRFRCKFHGQPEPQVKWYQPPLRWLHIHRVKWRQSNLWSQYVITAQSLCFGATRRTVWR